MAFFLIVLTCLLFSGCDGTPSIDSTTPSASEVLERRAEKGPVALHVKVWPAEPKLSDLVEMDVVVSGEPDVELKAPAFGQGVGDFLVRDYSEKPAEATAGSQRRFHYQLEPVHAGKHLIRSVAIEFIDRRVSSETKDQPVLVETDPLELTVTSRLGEGAPDLANLEPMLPPEPLPGTVGWYRWGIGLLIPMIAALAIWRWRRKQGRPVEPRRETAAEIAHAALNALLSEQLPARGLFKEFYLRLTGIVRRYIEETTGIRAGEQTTEEFLRDMRRRETFSPERSVRLAEFLEAADMVKYAGQNPDPTQIDESILRAREFVDMRPEPVSTAAAAT